jgi:hypothetical protein
MDDVKDLEKKATTQATTLKAKVDALQVIDQASYDLANQINKEAYDGKKAFHVWFDVLDEASKAQRKATIAQGKVIDDPFDYIIQTTASRKGKWRREQEAIAAQKQAEADTIARKKAEDKQLEEAELLQSMGMNEAAEEALVAEPVIERTVIEAPAKAAGTVLRDYYSAEVTDLMALVKAVAAGQAPLEAVEANMPYLNGKARLEKGGMKVPGVRAVVESKEGRRG